MKRIVFSIVLIAIVQYSFAKKVKFSVDMRFQTISTFGVHVSGDFQDEAGFPNDWESGTTEMINEPGTSIYSVVVDIPANRKYEYRFINGDQTYESEFVPEYSRVGYDFVDNRWVFIPDNANDTIVLVPVLFGANAPFGQKMLRVLVDMAKQSSINANGVFVNESTQLYNFIDKVYEVMLYTDSATAITYKFYNGSNAEPVPVDCATAGARQFTLYNDTILPVVCFASCTDCASTGVNEQYSEENGFSIYPNPTSNNFQMQFASTNAKEIQIVNTQGQLVYSNSNVNEQSLEIKDLDLPTGLYLVKLKEATKLSTVKLIVQ
jgi:hypothetical protein